MGLFLADGTRVTRATLSTTADPDPLVTIDTDLYRRVRTGREDDVAEGTLHTVFSRAGDRIMRQSQADNLFSPVVIDQVLPSQGVQAGGTEVVLVGRELDGVTAVKFGANAATAVTPLSDRECSCVAPAGAALGAVDVTVTGDAGDTVVADGYTYV